MGVRLADIHLSQTLRKAGALCTGCTINPGENEAVVRYALDTYKLLSLAPQHPRIGGPDLVGRLEFPDGYTEEWLRPRGGRTLFVLYLGPPYLDLVQILGGT
ncbi:hypothetical protein ACFX2F_046051 [Malus domestica]